VLVHLRAVVPAERTAAVTDLLRAEPGATNVVVLPGAALEPPGDLVLADVAREAVDALLERMSEQCLPHGSLTLQELDLALGEVVQRAEDEAPGQGVDAVVWDEVAATTSEDSVLSAAYLLFLVIATMIASVGLLLDSQVLIVGAMVLGPEFGPLAGAAVGLVQHRWAEVRRSLRALAVGFPLAVLATAGFVALLQVAGQVPQEYVDGRRPLTAFVSHPDSFSVIVALLAGVAGTVSLTAAKSSTLVGVFISITTVPAAAEVGTAVVAGSSSEAWGAAIQLVVNLSCIVLAATLTLLAQRSLLRRRPPAQ